MRILVTGGAGYIGSFMVKALIDRGDSVVVFDNLERGHESAIDPRAVFVKGDLKKINELEKLFGGNQIEAVMHFAGLISVEESTKKPDLYYQNNVVGSENLFSCAIEIGKVKKIIFSSTAAVYGNPKEIPIPENHPKDPTSKYGETKLEVENILNRIRQNNSGVSFAALRYFNAAGAATDGNLGENHKPETHIIPLAIKAAIGASQFDLFGTDYDTPDGTCIRDYIHVLDLVEAHILALEKIGTIPGEYYYNVGTGNGFSNKEVIEMVEKTSGKKINVVERARRAGDADRLIADPTRIKAELGFAPLYSDLKTIVESAWEWHSRR